MNTQLSSKSVALVSALIFVIGLVMLYLDVLGLLPLFMVILSFFISVVSGVLYLSGHRQGNVSGAYQHSTKAMADALHLGITRKK